MITVGYILADPKHPTTEEKAALAFLRKRYGTRRVRTVSPRPSSDPSLPKGLPVVWWHYDSSTILPGSMLTPEVVAAMRRYVHEGGSLLLSLAASQYVVDLGMESVRPNMLVKGTWQEICWAAGQRDIRGFASRSGHPIFDGLDGAAYTWAPDRGVPFTSASYDAPLAPLGGSVVAVEREYIKVNEAHRHIVEYTYGKGRVLTIGSFFYFASPSSPFRLHLEKMTDNALTYLATPASVRKRRTYWSMQPASFEEVPRHSPLLKITPAPWRPEYSSSGVLRQPATTNAFDVGGRRILIIGEERKGISEVWVPPLRILRDIGISLRTEGEGYVRADALEGDITIRPESVTRKHRIKDAIIEETIFGDRTLPAGAIHFLSTAGHPVTISFSARIDLRNMWPLPAGATGMLRYGWDDGHNGFVTTDGWGEGMCVIGSVQKPVSHRITRRERDHHELIIELEYVLTDQAAGLTIAFAGSDRDEREAVWAYQHMLAQPSKRLTARARHGQMLLERTTVIEGPDEEFNDGYRQALLATERFVATTSGPGTSLMAGFGTTATGWNGGHAVSGRPGYAWYVGRDSVWTSFAMLDCGMADEVRTVLEFLGSHQDLTGKIMHEMTTSGFVNYDAADSTPLYLILMGRYLRTTGDRAFARSQYDRIRRALTFCFSTDSDRDHLIENTNVGHGWIEGGKLIPIHTEFYLASCWAEALDQTAYIAQRLRDNRLARRCTDESLSVKKTMRRSFWNPETLSYNYGKNADGSFRKEETVFPSVAMYFGQTEREKASPGLDRFASSRFSTDWGTRIVGTDSPLYNPAAYHYGSIWPLITGWTSLAEFMNDRPAAGFVHAMSNLLLGSHWALGYTPEVLHGEKMESVGICQHQAWSSAMVIQPLLEGMLGFRVDAIARRIVLKPYFPPDWERAEVRNLHVGTAKVTMTMRRRMNRTSFIFSTTSSKPLRLEFRPWLAPGTTIHAIRVGRTVKLHAIHVGSHDDVPVLELSLKGELRVTYEHTGGIAAIPPIARPKPGDDSTGLRLLKEEWKHGCYEVTVEGKGDRLYTLVLLTEGRPLATEKAWTMSVAEGRLTLALQFDEAGVTSQYRRKTVRVPMNF